MNVVFYSNDTILIDRYHTLCEEYHYQIISDYDALYIEVKKEPTIVIMNIEECDNDIESCLFPLIELGTNFIILDPLPNFIKGKKLLNLGVRGYGNLMMDDIHLKDTINNVQDGNIWLYPQFINEVVNGMTLENSPNHFEKQLERLTTREKEVARLVLQKLGYNEIALKLDITLRTVKAHTKNIYDKYDVSNRLAFLLLFNN